MTIQLRAARHEVSRTISSEIETQGQGSHGLGALDCRPPELLPPAQKPINQSEWTGRRETVKLMKYLIGLGALVVVVVGYLVLSLTEEPSEPPAPASQPAPTPAVPSAPEAIAPDETAAPALDENELLEQMVADVRERLPSTISDTLTMTDAVFLQRMRIVEYFYVTTSADVRASASDLRSLIEARSETICIDGRDMFELGATLRNSFADRDGNLLQRAYLLPEDCQRYY